MMVRVAGRGDHVTVAAVRAMESVQHVVLRQQIEGPEDRGPPDARQVILQLLYEFIGRKGAGLPLSCLNHPSARTRQSVATLLEDLQRLFRP
jgi:hypothetical protein